MLYATELHVLSVKLYTQYRFILLYNNKEKYKKKKKTYSEINYKSCIQSYKITNITLTAYYIKLSYYNIVPLSHTTELCITRKKKSTKYNRIMN